MRQTSTWLAILAVTMTGSAGAALAQTSRGDLDARISKVLNERNDRADRGNPNERFRFGVDDDRAFERRDERRNDRNRDGRRFNERRDNRFDRDQDRRMSRSERGRDRFGIQARMGRAFERRDERRNDRNRDGRRFNERRVNDRFSNLRPGSRQLALERNDRRFDKSMNRLFEKNRFGRSGRLNDLGRGRF